MKKHKQYKIGDVVRNQTSGCQFVVEKCDLSTVNMYVNKNNYVYQNTSFGECNHKHSDLIGKIIVARRKKGLISKYLWITGEVLRSPYSGKLAVDTHIPYCLDCNVGISIDSLKDIKEKY
ncbi:MAG: hypothetical protein ACTSPI_11690, partial [Candidatus Heimdallarchaeaceae archaeon]